MLTVNVEETAGALVRDGMSPALADRACLAAASVLGIPVLTADTAWPVGGVPLGIKVIVIR